MTATLTPGAAVQRRLWGTDARGWADLAEPHNRPLFEAVLDATGVTAGTRVLDVGCGTGLTLVLAAERGAQVAGLDVTPELLDVARERLPDADLREGEMEALPFADANADVVLGVNAFQFATDPVLALREAARVLRPGGALAASLFAAPERSESTRVHEALQSLLPPAGVAEHAPYALSAPGGLERALAAAGLAVEADGEVALDWAYASRADAVHGLLCSAGGARAAEAVGAPRVRATLDSALATFEDRATGRVTMRNTFRWVTARRPA